MNTVISLVLAVSLVVIEAGCRRANGDRSAARQPAPSEVSEREPFLTVITDPAAIEAARRLAVRTAPAASAREILAGMYSVSLDRLPPEVSRDVADVRLREIARDTTADSRARATAACLLALLDPQTGQEEILSLLRGSDGAGKEDLLDRLGWLDDGALKVTHVELQRELLKLTDDDKLGITAIRACGHLAWPEVAAELWKALPAATGEKKAEILFWLVSVQPDRRSLDACAAALRDLPGKHRKRCLVALGGFLQCSDASLAEAATEAMVDELLARLGDGKARPFDFPQLTCDSVLRHGTGPKAVALVNAIALRSKDKSLQVDAYRAARRREGSEGRRRIAEGLGRAEEFAMAVDACTDIYAKTADPVIVKALMRQATERRAPGELASVGRALLAVGGAQAEVGIRVLAGRLPLNDGKQLLMALDRKSPGAQVGRLLAAGILRADRVDTAALVARVEAQLKAAHGKGAQEGIGVLDLLEAAGIMLTFDVETDETPVRHDRLIADLAKASGGVFQPEAGHERTLRSRDKDDEFSYEVQFIHGDRLYRFTARDFGDWYDVERVAAACNLALSDTGVSERFCQAAGDGQCASFICVTPAQASVLAEQFHVPFEDKADAAMRQGKEFEQRVIRVLKGD